MEAYSFAVDQRPMRVWDWELQEKNLEFLKGVDPEYFVHIAQMNSALLGDEKNHRAALAIRLAYSHALETFMAFAAATMQAPACPMGWLLRYSNADLRNVVEKLTRGRVEYSRLPGAPTWEGLATTVVSELTATTAEKGQITERFTQLWTRFAGDFLDSSQELEYNNLKHGLRVAPGGFAIRFGLEPSYGVSPPAEAMTVLGASEYGSSFYLVEKPVGGKIDFRPRRFARNWHPENLFSGIELLTLSLGNLVSYLRLYGGDDSPEIRFRWSQDPDAYSLPWRHRIGVTTSNFDYTLTAEDIEASTAEEVLEDIRRSIESNTNMDRDDHA